MSRRAQARRRHGPLTVPVGDLLRAPGTRRHAHVEGAIGDLAVTGSAVADDTVVALEVELDSVSRGIVVSGTVSADWEGECRRCAEPVRGTVSAEVRELFVAPDAFRRVAETGDEEETYPLHGDEVDLEPLARDAVLLALPPAPLCAEQCRGLCPTCGANRNEDECACEAET